MIEHCIATQPTRTMEDGLLEAIYLLSVFLVSHPELNGGVLNLMLLPITWKHKKL